LLDQGSLLRSAAPDPTIVNGLESSALGLKPGAIGAIPSNIGVPCTPVWIQPEQIARKPVDQVGSCDWSWFFVFDGAVRR
jgi:hypothetical protein